MPFISTNTWVLKIIDGTLSHRMKALGGYALYDEAFAQVEAARLLLEKGAAVDAQVKDGRTPLMMACQTGHVEMARLLLEKGADRTLPTPWGPPLLEVIHRLGLPEEKVAQLRALLA